MQVGHDAAAGVMRGWHDRDRRARDVNTVLQAARIHGWEMASDEVCGFVADVEQHVLQTQTLYFVVDGAGHDVARRQFATRIEALHEARFVGQQQQAAFATQCFGD